MNILERFGIVRRAAFGLFSDDSLRQAQGMLNQMLGGSRSNPPDRTVESYLKAYTTMPWLHAVANKVATSVASTEWQLFTALRPDTRKAIRRNGLQHMPRRRREVEFARLKHLGELQQLDSHVMLDTLAYGNSLDIGMSVVKTTQLHLDLVGEGFWMKDRGPLQQPNAIWPLPPHWVRDTPSPMKRSYRVSVRGFNEDVADEEILWFKHPDPAHPYQRGKGITRALGDELETDEYAAKMLRQYFYNRGEPQFLVMPDSDLGMGSTEVKRMERQWARRAGGFMRAFKPLFMGQKVKVHEFKRDFRQMQLSQLREHERNTIIQVWGVPPELLGVLENSNRATIDAAAYLFGRWVIEPRLEFLRATLQERFVPEYDERLILGFASPVDDDREFQLKVFEAAPWAFDLDTVRAIAGFEGLGEDEGGAMRWVPSDGSLVDNLEEAHQVPAAPVDTGRAPPEDNDAIDVSVLKAFADSAKLTPGAQIVSRRENSFAATTRHVFEDAEASASVKTIVGRLGKGQSNAAVMRESFKVLDGYGDAVSDQIIDAYVEAFEQAAASANITIERAGISQAEMQRQAAAWSKRASLNLTRNTVIGEQRNMLKMLRQIAAERGWKPRTLALRMRQATGLTIREARSVARFYDGQIAEGVRDSWADARASKLAQTLRRRRAETIARTTMADAVQEGQQRMWANAQTSGQLKKSARQRWRAQPDASDPKCLALDGTTTKIGGTFAGGVSRPPLHPRCRCDLELVAQ